MNWLAFLIGLLPAAWLALGVQRHTLGPNPIEAITHGTGDWILYFLVLTLLASPIARLSKRSEPLKIRRALGLLAFFYACVHLLIYMWLDKGLDWGEIGKDLAKRRFIWAGMASFLLMVPLALTSTNAAIRALGHRWKTLHRLVYPAAVLGGLHYYLLVKADISMPVAFLGAFGVLIGYRAWRRFS